MPHGIMNVNERVCVLCNLTGFLTSLKDDSATVRGHSVAICNMKEYEMRHFAKLPFAHL